MGKIICLMGKSSTGKDTIYKRLLEDQELHLKKLIPYTTRPIREGEQEGIEYHFVDEKHLQKLEEEGRIVELRAYDTVYGVWKYFTVREESMDLEKESYAVIGTLDSWSHERVFWGRAYDSGVRGSGGWRTLKQGPCKRAAAGRTQIYGALQKISGGHGRFFRETSERSRNYGEI